MEPSPGHIRCCVFEFFGVWGSVGLLPGHNLAFYCFLPSVFLDVPETSIARQEWGHPYHWTTQADRRSLAHRAPMVASRLQFLVLLSVFVVA